MLSTSSFSLNKNINSTFVADRLRNVSAKNYLALGKNVRSPGDARGKVIEMDVAKHELGLE